MRLPLRLATHAFPDACVGLIDAHSSHFASPQQNLFNFLFILKLTCCNYLCLFLPNLCCCGLAPLSANGICKLERIGICISRPNSTCPVNLRIIKEFAFIGRIYIEGISRLFDQTINSIRVVAASALFWKHSFTPSLADWIHSLRYFSLSNTFVFSVGASAFSCWFPSSKVEPMSVIFAASDSG
jgi:hypothetical protein